MELQIPSFPIIFTFFLFVFMILKMGKRSNTNNSASNLPPGPWKLPLIGNIHNLVGSLPHHTLRDLAKKHGPLMHLQLGEISTIVVSSPETAKEVMKIHDVIFANRPYLLASRVMSYNSTNIVFAPYGEYWRQLRKICISELLSPKRVQSFRSIREEAVQNLISSIASSVGSPINLTEKVYSSAYGITSTAAFGKKCKEQETFVSIIKESIVIGGGFNIADLYPSITWLRWISGMMPTLVKLHQKADMIMGNIIDEHKEDKATRTDKGEADDDLVDVLLKFQEHGTHDIPLTNDNIKAVILDIFGAGSETSATTVDWAMSELIKNPKVMEKAQAEVRQVFKSKGNVDETSIHELKYLKLVIKETLRLHPAAPLLIPRECGEKCEINGYTIPFKAKVIVNAWAIGRDPKLWANSECFIPERFFYSSIDYKGLNFEYIPFGAGRRICPGISFGMANIELPLAQFLYHFDWRLPNGMKGEELDMTETFGVTVRRKEDLYLVPIAYQPSPDEV